MSRPRHALCITIACALIGALAPAAASASRGEVTFFEAPGQLLNPATRAHTMATLQKLGVSALRIELSWHAVAPAPNSVHRPAFDATNPASYDWAAYDPVIEEADRRGWDVLLTVTAPVPRWAQADPASRTLVYRPSASMFQQFMTAVGRHFAGRVGLFGVWNEPNHHEFLEPQFESRGQPASPRIYRSLYEAAWNGLRAAGIAQPALLFGETAPEGQASVRRPVRPRQNVGPLAFLRGALCLNGSYRRSSACARVPLSGYAVHPYPSALGPLRAPFNPESVTIASLGRLTSALDRAARAGALPAHVPVYITEFGIMSKPNRFQGVAPSVQAEYDAISEHIAWSNPRVASFAQYLLKDDPTRGRSVAFQTGLEYYDGGHKALYAGFPVPLTVTRSGGRYSLWGLIRPAHGATTLTVEYEPSRSRRFRVLAAVPTDAAGYWTLRSRVGAAAWRVRWRSPEGATYLGPAVHAR